MNFFDTFHFQLPTEGALLGLAFIFAFIAGNFAKYIKVPKVTAYILVGVILGPSVLNVFTTEMAESYHTINEVAFGLILFNIGGEFHRGLFKNLALKHLTHSAILAFGIFTITSLICYLFSFATDMSSAQQIAFSLMLGTIAIAAAPPTTLLVIKELDSEGPLTHIVIVFLAVGTIITLIISQAFTIAFESFGIWNESNLSIAMQFLKLAWKTIGSLLIGVFLGFILSLIVQKEKKEGEVLLAIICIILFGQTTAHMIGLDPLLTSLFIGFALVNIAPTGMSLHKILKDAGSSIYALFFVLAGAHIHIQEQLETVGIIGLGYILARTIAIFISSYFSAYISKEPKVIGKFMGPAILSHAGAALAIAMTLKDQHDQSAQMVMTVIMGSIFFFEIVGPLTLKFALKAIGETNLTQGFSSGATKVIHSPKELVINFLINTGLITKIKDGEEEVVSQFVCKNILTIDQNATFAQVTKFINDHVLPIYTVIDDEGNFIGTIGLDSVRRAKGKFNAPSSTIANDLATCRNNVCEASTLEEAIELFDALAVSALPVVRVNSNKLIGILYYKDIVLV